jgi:hypothetical protein
VKSLVHWRHSHQEKHAIKPQIGGFKLEHTGAHTHHHHTGARLVLHQIHLARHVHSVKYFASGL